MINILKKGRDLPVNLIPKHRRYKGKCEDCEGEYTCSRSDLVGDPLFIEKWVVGMIKCPNQTCKSKVTVKKSRF